MTVRTWHTTSTAAEHVGVHRDTVLKACEAGVLHGVQRKKRGRWRIAAACLDAWAGGERCPHKGRSKSADDVARAAKAS